MTYLMTYLSTYPMTYPQGLLTTIEDHIDPQFQLWKPRQQLQRLRPFLAAGADGSAAGELITTSWWEAQGNWMRIRILLIYWIYIYIHIHNVVYICICGIYIYMYRYSV